MKILENKGRIILRTVGLAAALAVAFLPVSKVAASDCTDEAACEAACPPLLSPGHFACVKACRALYPGC